MKKRFTGRGSRERDTTRINDAIREDEVRLIDAEGEHAGVVAVPEALKMAEAAGLDLVEVSAKSKPHVCRIMDYGQYKYEIAKKQKEAKKKQKLIVVKDIKMRPRIDQHDYEFKLNHAKKFLEHGDKVRFIMQFRGREMAHKDLGRKVLDRVVDDLLDIGLVEQEPRMEGRVMNMTISPAPPKKTKSKSEGDDNHNSAEPIDINEIDIDESENSALAETENDE